MGTIHGRWASSQASAIWAGVARCRWAIWPSRSMMGWLAVRASGLKRGEPAADAPPGTNAREKARRAYLSLEGLDL